MAREGADFSESEVIYPPAVDGAPSRALVSTSLYPSAAPAPGMYPSRGPEILSGGFNQTWLAHCLRRRWLMAILMGMLVGAGVAGLLLLAFPKTSQVTAYLKVKSKIENVFETTTDRLMPQEIERQAMNHLALLKSPLVLDAALQDQDIANLDAVRAHKGQEMLWLLDELRVTFPGDGEILEVRYEGDEDPDQMVMVIDAVVKAYQEKVLLQDRLQVASTQSDLKTVLAETKARLEGQLRDLEARQKSAGNLREEIEIPQLSNEIKTLEDLIAKTQKELVDIEVFKELNVQNSQNPATVEAAIGMELEKDPTINMYKTQLFELNSQLQQKLSTSKNPNSADINRVRSVIQQTQAQMDQYQGQAARALREKISKMPNDALRAAITEYNIRRKSANENLTKYQKELEEAHTKLDGLGMRNPEQEMLEGQIESEKEIASNLQEKVLEWDVMSKARDRQERAGGASEFDKVTVMQKATALEGGNTLERYSIAGIGGLAAMALTCYGIALLEFRHRRLNGAADVDEGLGIRVLGVLPSTSLKALTGNSLVATQVAEAIDNVRATLMHDAGAGGRQVIMVTSSATMEGTTVVASSLALSMARAGRRTLLVDGDLRSPSLHKLFSMPIEDGLSEVLRSEIDLVDAIKPTNNEGLYMLTAGVCNAEAIHALATDQPQAIFEKLRDQFDFIIIDAPPVLGISDSLSLGQYIDGAILTVLRDHSEIRKVYKAVEMLKGMGVRVLGSVVNGMPMKADRRVVRLHQSGGSNAPRLTKVDG
jgi:capsular exopolysaccharide synthesis family protein